MSATPWTDHAALRIGGRDDTPGWLQGVVHVKPHCDRRLVLARLIVQAAVDVDAAKRQPEA
jgi:hypothetical protein